jgi:superfamily II RNA helicase
MVLNLLRVDELNPEYMMSRSFHQFQNDNTLPDLERSTRLDVLL